MSNSEPALITSLLSAGASLIAVFFIHVTPVEAAYIATLGTAAAALVTAVAATPRQVPVIAGAIASLFAAGATFGLHLPAADDAVISAFIAALFGIILRAHVTPAPLPGRSRPVPPA